MLSKVFSSVPLLGADRVPVQRLQALRPLIGGDPGGHLLVAVSGGAGCPWPEWSLSTPLGAHCRGHSLTSLLDTVALESNARKDSSRLDGDLVVLETLDLGEPCLPLEVRPRIVSVHGVARVRL